MYDSIFQHKNGTGKEISAWSIFSLILKKFHWLLLSGAAIALAVFFAVSFLVTPTYKSTATFYVYNSSNGVSTSGVINNNDLQAAESLASTYSKIFQSNAVLDSVLQDLNYRNKLSRKELSVGSQSNGYLLGTYTDEKGKEQSVWLNINEITPDSSWSQDEIDEINKTQSCVNELIDQLNQIDGFKAAKQK